MSTGDDAEAGEIAEQIEDYPDLYPRHVGGNRYRVLSLGGDEPTAYAVDIGALDCDCSDFQKRREDPEVCKHLATALEAAPPRLSIEAETFDSLVNLWSEAADTVQDIKDVRDVAQTAQNANAAAAAQQAAESGTQTAGADPVSRVESWLEANDVPSDGVDVWEHEEYGSIQLETNGNLSDAEFDRFRELTDDDLVKYDRNERVNYIQADDLEAVVG